MLGMQLYLHTSPPQEGQLNFDLSQLEAAAQPYYDLGLVWDYGERVVDTDHHILLVVAMETIDLGEMEEDREG